MNTSGGPVWVMVTMAAWLACGLYFIASAFATQRIQSKEAKGERAKDTLLLLGGYVFLFVQLPAVELWSRPFLPAGLRQPLGIAGAALAVVGLSFTCWARATLGRYWSRIVAVKEDHKLVTTGPYQWVRHPLYTGLLAGTLGAALAFGAWHGLIGAAMLWTGFIGRAYREDDLMAAQFGAEFAAYRARSGRLVPRL